MVKSEYYQDNSEELREMKKILRLFRDIHPRLEKVRESLTDIFVLLKTGEHQFTTLTNRMDAVILYLLCSRISMQVNYAIIIDKRMALTFIKFKIFLARAVHPQAYSFFKYPLPLFMQRSLVKLQNTL